MRSLNPTIGERPTLTLVIRHGGGVRLDLIRRFEFPIAECPRVWLTRDAATEVVRFDRKGESDPTSTVVIPRILEDDRACPNLELDGKMSRFQPLGEILDIPAALLTNRAGLFRDFGRVCYYIGHTKAT